MPPPLLLLRWRRPAATVLPRCSRASRAGVLFGSTMAEVLPGSLGIDVAADAFAMVSSPPRVPTERKPPSALRGGGGVSCAVHGGGPPECPAPDAAMGIERAPRASAYAQSAEPRT
mmetsp:Transcript_15230/g.44855  ORF Transcript_15230/g.44855 Transcript_15230/m.44855 type:complete len:116 (+) Transcript_15230:2107-2454(+)